MFKPAATPTAGYVQDRNADGSWRQAFDPAGDDGFAEGSSAQFLATGGTLVFRVALAADASGWGTAPADRPPSFPPR